MQSKYLWYLKLVLVALWAIVVLWNFLQHFPMLNLTEVILKGLMLGILLLFFTALGRRVLKIFRIEFTSFGEECCFAFGIGSGLIIWLMIGLAAVGLLYKMLIVCLILGLFGLVYHDAKYLCLQGYKILTDFAWSAQPVGDVVLLVLMGFTGIVTFIAAATPPFFYDALVYHLAVPQKYLTLHGFHYIPSNHNANFPANLGMLFIVALSFSDELFAQLVSWAFTPLTVLAVYAFAKPRWGRRIALMSAAILFLVPGILIAATVTTVDAGVMFYSFLSFTALLSWFSSRQRHWFVLSGIFCSLAIGTKYPAIAVTALPLGLMVFVHEYFAAKRQLLHALRNLVVIGLIVLCGIAPWIVKNYVYTGNPFHPFFNSLFGAQGSQIVDYNEYLRRANTFFGEEEMNQPWLYKVGRYLQTPWLATMGVYGFAGATGVVFLLCLPLLFCFKKMDAPVRYLLVIAGSSYWLWVLLLPATVRYVFPMFPPLSIVTAFMLWQISDSPRWRKWMSGGLMVILVYHLLFLFVSAHGMKQFTYLFGNQSQEQFLLAQGVNYYPTMQYINAETPLDAKILFVGETRGTYCERDYILYAVPFVGHFDDQEILLQKLIIESQRVEDVIQKLRDLKITHILVDRFEMKRLTEKSARKSYFNFPTEKDRRIFQELFSPCYLRPLKSQYEVDLYAVNY